MAKLISLGRVRVRRAEYARAESPLHEAVNNCEKTDRDNWHRYHAQSPLGASLAGQRKYAEAEPLLLGGYEGMLQRQAAIPADTRSVVEEARERIVRLYQDCGMPEKAAAWREKIQVSRVEP